MGGLPSGSDDSQYDLGDWGVASTGISGLANRNQTNVQNALKAKVQGSPTWGTASDALWGDMTPAAGDGPLLTLLKALGEAIGVTVTTILGGTSGIGNVITEHTEAIATLEEIAALNSSPAYLADIQDMATCPRRDCAVYGEELSAYTDILAGIQCPISTHYHYLNTSVIRPEVVVGSSQGTIYYTPVIVDRIGSLKGIRWMVGPDYLFSINYYEMALCALDISSGDVVKLWGSGNIKDGLPASSGDLNEAYIEFDFDPPQITTPGQVLFVAHQQTAPGGLQQPRRLAAAMAPNAGRPDQILDAATYLAEDYSQGIPSSISFASLTRENRFIPWGAVRVDTSETL